MRDPYLYEDVDVLKNRANIKDAELLRTAEADITNLAMTAIYDRKYDKFILIRCSISTERFSDRFMNGEASSVPL